MVMALSRLIEVHLDIYSANDIKEICGFLAFALLLRRFFIPDQTSTTEEERDGYFSIEERLLAALGTSSAS
jgi:hypothetical protein